MKSKTKRKRLTDILDRKIPSKEHIAKKHGLDADTFDALLTKGTRVEMEHTSRWDVAERIALAHLNERPDYYRLLKKHVEKDIKEDMDVKSIPSTRDIITRPARGRKPSPRWYDSDEVFHTFKEKDSAAKAHELPKHFGVSKEEVAAAFSFFKEKHGYNKMPSGLYHPVNANKLKELDQNGVSHVKMAEHFNTDPGTIRQHLRRLSNEEGYKPTARLRGGNEDRSKFWTDDKLAELDKHLADPSKPPREIMKTMGITQIQYSTALASAKLKTKLKNAGVKRENIGGPKWMTPEHKEKLKQLDQSGKETLSSMGMKLGQPIHAIKIALDHLEKTEGYKRSDRSANRGGKLSRSFNTFIRTK